MGERADGLLLAAGVHAVRVQGVGRGLGGEGEDSGKVGIAQGKN